MGKLVGAPEPTPGPHQLDLTNQGTAHAHADTQSATRTWHADRTAEKVLHHKASTLPGCTYAVGLSLAAAPAASTPLGAAVSLRAVAASGLLAAVACVVSPCVIDDQGMASGRRGGHWLGQHHAPSALPA